MGDRVFATDSQGAVRIAKRNADGKYAWDGHLALKAPAVGGVAYPTGIALQGESHAWVCASRGNELQLMKLDDGEVEARVPVGVAPYMPIVVGEKVYVSNWGGDHPGKDDPTHKTSGTPVKTDPRTNVATTVACRWWRRSATSGTRRKCRGRRAPPASSRASRHVRLSNATSDTVSVIDTVTAGR